MKKSMLLTLLASVSLMAVDSTSVKTSGSFGQIDGETLYKKKCAICHGEKGEKTPHRSGQIGGMELVPLALEIRAYRDQDERNGAYSLRKDSRVMKDATSGLSQKEIVAIAKYVNGLK